MTCFFRTQPSILPLTFQRWTWDANHVCGSLPFDCKIGQTKELKSRLLALDLSWIGFPKEIKAITDISVGCSEPIIICCNDAAVLCRGQAPNFVLVGPEGKVLSWAGRCWGPSSLNKGKPGLQPLCYKILHPTYIFGWAGPAVCMRSHLEWVTIFGTVFLLVLEMPT